jgi:alpha-glucosidase
MFGIPHVGADVCGFHGNYENEMCGRWMQLSAFYPFARNNYNDTYEENLVERQEPYVLKEPQKTAARNAIYQRYSFLRYFYTVLYN